VRSIADALDKIPRAARDSSIDAETAEGEGEHALPASIDHPAVATNKKKIRERIDYVVRGLDANGAGSTLLERH